MRNEDFVHLHTHTEFSVLDGLGTADDYTKKASEMGFKSIAITDHGNVDGAVRWNKACNDNKIKPIFGCEFYIVPNMDIKEKGENRGHILTLAKNKVGFRNILKMLSIANLEGFYYRPRIDFNNFFENIDGLIVSTACPSSFINLEGGIDFFKKLNSKLKEDLYLELMNSYFFVPDGDKKIKKLFELYKEFKTKFIVTNDCHYINKSGNRAQEVLLAIQKKVKWSDPNRWKFSVRDLYLKSADDIIDGFSDRKDIQKDLILDGMRNTKEISDKINFQLEKLEINLPKIKESKSIDECEFLMNLIVKGYKEKKSIFVDKPSIYRKRYKREFETIKKLGFVRYFLIVWELVKWCNENNILSGPGRGSAAGSLIAWLIGITKVDPIKFGLLFERFISEDRNDLPDIDVDFEDRYRNKVRIHLEELYGKDQVAGITTFLRMKSRMVLKDVSRVFEVPYKEVNDVTKLIYSNLKDVFNDTLEGSKFYKKYRKVSKIALDLEGQIRGVGQNAAGIVIVDEPFESGKNGYLVKRGRNYVSNWDKYDTEYMGMLKLDVLGLSALSVLHYAFDLIKKNHGKEVNYDIIDLDDDEVYEEFREGNCTGIFQFGTYGLKKLVQEIRVDSFNMLSIATALYRPAPLQSGLTDSFKSRRNGFEKWKYVYKGLRPILKDTLGIIIYQEQIMLAVSSLSGFSFHKSDKMRKVLDKNDSFQIESFKDDFIKGCMKHSGIREDQAKQIWDEIKNWAGYSFGKSHAYAYTMISYFDMWTKINFPAEFICASLTYGSDDIKNDLLVNAIEYGLDINFPKVGFSNAEVWETDGKNLYMPFIEIKGFGEVLSNKAQNISKNKAFFEDKRSVFSGNMLKLLEGINAFEEGIPNDIEGKLSFDIDKKLFNYLKGENENEF